MYSVHTCHLKHFWTFCLNVCFSSLSLVVDTVHVPIYLFVCHAYTSKEIKCIGNSKLAINHGYFAFILFLLSVGVFGIACVEY